MRKLDALVEGLKEHRKLGMQVSSVETLPAESADWVELPAALPAALRRVLHERGIERLYRHQAEGMQAALAGEDVLLTTPTASGKSLVFQLPPLIAALEGRDARALFLYPLKALGRDQEGKLKELAAACGLDPREVVAVYDGDTPREERQRIRENPPRVLITNPDMLHLGILPAWQSWAPFLADLRWFVLDELHAYRGVFGAHQHHVLWRLERICDRAVGGRLAVIASSATASNADEFASALCDRDFRWIRDSGAPRERRFLATLDPVGSAYTAAVDLTAFLLDQGLKTIVFTKARRVTELIYAWLTRQRPDLTDRVANYRSGFLAGERRAIEEELFSGTLDGVISTSALELGIDVGGLDACVLVGFPGSLMATWQRSGRVGRQGRDSLTALIPLPDALDRWFVDHPDDLTSRQTERLVVDPDNRQVVAGQLLCAAAEKPLAPETEPALERRRPDLKALVEEGRLTRGDDGRLYSVEARPHNEVNLRGAGDAWLVVDRTLGERADDKPIGTLDGIRVLREGHPGAIYLHGGCQYLVRELDFDARKVICERASVSYYTQPLTEKRTEVLEALEHRHEGGPEAPNLEGWFGRLRVTERVIGFERRKINGRELLDRHDLDLPPAVIETEGLWWSAPPAIEAGLVADGHDFMGSLHAAEHTTIALVPLFAVCDRNDLGGISIPMHAQLLTGGVFVYDGHPGGAGIAERAFAQLPELLTRVRDHLHRCPCEDGCPSCVQSPKCGNGNRPLDKTGAEAFLSGVLGREAAVEAVAAPRPVWERSDWQPSALPEDVERRGRVVFEGDVGAPESGGRDAAWLSGIDGEAAIEVPPPAPLAPPRPQNPANTVLFDLETVKGADDVGGWHNIHKMRVAVGVSLHLQSGKLRVFREDDVKELIDQLAAADLVVGYNILRFDYQVLSGYTGADYARRWPTLDLLREVYNSTGMRLSMGALAEETLGEGKSADGLTSLRWVCEGKLDKVIDYCRRDVEVLRDLYLFGRREGYLKARNDVGEVVRVPVGW